ITYELLVPASRDRDRLLSATGHGYLPAAVHLVLPIVLIGVALGFLGRIGRRDRAAIRALGELGPRIAALPAVAFVGMEIAERIGADASVGGLGHVVPVGIAVQLVVGVLVAAVVRIILRAGDAAESLGRPAPGSPPRTIPRTMRPLLCVLTTALAVPSA